MKDIGERWNKNLEHLISGGFGDTTKPETLLNYWYAQESAGYPGARENVQYFEEMCGMERKPLGFEKIYDYAGVTDEMSNQRERGDKMNEHYATEIAYKNGYARGKADCAREIIEDIASLIEKHWSDIKYYWLINGRSDDMRNLLKTIEKKYTEGAK